MEAVLWKQGVFGEDTAQKLIDTIQYLMGRKTYITVICIIEVLVWFSIGNKNSKSAVRQNFKALSSILRVSTTFTQFSRVNLPAI